MSIKTLRWINSPFFSFNVTVTVWSVSEVNSASLTFISQLNKCRCKHLREIQSYSINVICCDTANTHIQGWAVPPAHSESCSETRTNGEAVNVCGAARCYLCWRFSLNWKSQIMYMTVPSPSKFNNHIINNGFILSFKSLTCQTSWEYAIDVQRADWLQQQSSMSSLLTSCRRLQRLDGFVQRGLLANRDVKHRLVIRHDAITAAVSLTVGRQTHKRNRLCLVLSSTWLESIILKRTGIASEHTTYLKASTVELWKYLSSTESLE